MYWIAATILIVANAACLAANLLTLPGNWLMVLNLCLFLLAFGDPVASPDWTTLLVVLVLAIIGEIVEAFGGSAMASKKGASRRAMLLSLIVSMIGSVAGSFAIPIPVIGTAAGAVAGAALGAFAGAWLGETWMGSDWPTRKTISVSAMKGRMLGLVAKLAVGAAIFVFQLVSFW
ncbi:MAG: DUF456 domain-containing protein [Fuerstiella sp.]